MSGKNGIEMAELVTNCDQFGQIHELQKEAVSRTLDILVPEVERILHHGINDHQRIERALDQLLEVAFDETVLALFKKLCRHYYFINPNAAVFYVQSYREMWDEESLGQEERREG